MVGRAFEVLMALDSAVVFASALFLPLNAHPELIVGKMENRSEVAYDGWIVVEEYFAAYQGFLMFKIVCFEAFGLGFEVVLFGF